MPYNFNDSNENKKNINLFGSNKFKNISENSGNSSVFNLLNIPKIYKPNYSWKGKIRHSWGKKKLLRKRFDNIKTDFDFQNYLNSFNNYNSKSLTLEDTLMPSINHFLKIRITVN